MPTMQLTDWLQAERDRVRYKVAPAEVADFVIADQDFPSAVRAANDDYEDFTLVFENALL
ncbi:MAG: hypothetical protein AAFR02_00545 [Pseudomonadota bacterium]